MLAFYVVEYYVDPTYKFAGLWSFAAYRLRERCGRKHRRAAPPPKW